MLEISDRLRETLETYVIEGDPTGIEDLGIDVRKPASDWFLEEFESALRAGLFTPQRWGARLYNDDWTGEEAHELDRDLRRIWEAVAPDRSYPLDAPKTQ